MHRTIQKKDIAEAKKLLHEHPDELNESLIVDASHGNSKKNAENQMKVIESVARKSH